MDEWAKYVSVGKVVFMPYAGFMFYIALPSSVRAGEWVSSGMSLAIAFVFAGLALVIATSASKPLLAHGLWAEQQ